MKDVEEEKQFHSVQKNMYNTLAVSNRFAVELVDTQDRLNYIALKDKANRL